MYKKKINKLINCTLSPKFNKIRLAKQAANCYTLTNNNSALNIVYFFNTGIIKILNELPIVNFVTIHCNIKTFLEIYSKINS